ncbi:MAG TPA: DeoR/GlpR family DNA-binding transcription regulator [Caproiciproducens sp.]|nr:DeoR/GlpR family DNA-binding transcription regulator [Caproiciproducens sp.]
MSMDEQSAIPAERMKRILAYIEKKGSAQVRELARSQNVSEATIRRDLSELEKMGSIRRTHGGAVLTSPNLPYEKLYQSRFETCREEKKRIALLASKYVSDGDTVFLGSGTTVFQLALNLGEKRSLTVITNDLSIADAVVLHSSSQLIVTGGIRKSGEHVLVGSIPENFLRQVSMDKVFLSADAVDPEFGVSNANFVEAQIKTLAVQAGKEVIVLVDKTKFGKKALTKICQLNEVERIITDLGMPQAMIKKITEQGVALEFV